MSDHLPTPLPWVRSPKASDAVINPVGPCRLIEKIDYGGELVFKSCSKVNRQHIIECVTLRPAFEALCQAVKERCDNVCDGIECTNAEWRDGQGCAECDPEDGGLGCCRHCQVWLARAEVERVRAVVKAQSTELVVVTR